MPVHISNTSTEAARQILPASVQGWSHGPKKIENVMEFRNTNAPKGRIRCAFLRNFPLVKRLNLGVSLKGFRSCGGLTADGAIFPNFSAIPSDELYAGCENVLKVQEWYAPHV